MLYFILLIVYIDSKAFQNNKDQDKIVYNPYVK